MIYKQEVRLGQGQAILRRGLRRQDLEEPVKARTAYLAGAASPQLTKNKILETAVIWAAAKSKHKSSGSFGRNEPEFTEVFVLGKNRSKLPHFRQTLNVSARTILCLALSFVCPLGTLCWATTATLSEVNKVFALRLLRKDKRLLAT